MKKLFKMFRKNKNKKTKSASTIPDVNKDGKIDSIDFTHYKMNRGKTKKDAYKDTKSASTSPSKSTKGY